jgi:hypothetical protein
MLFPLAERACDYIGRQGMRFYWQGIPVILLAAKVFNSRSLRRSVILFDCQATYAVPIDEQGL